MSRNAHPLKPGLVKIALLVAPALIPVCLYPNRSRISGYSVRGDLLARFTLPFDLTRPLEGLLAAGLLLLSCQCSCREHLSTRLRQPSRGSREPNTRRDPIILALSNLQLPLARKSATRHDLPLRASGDHCGTSKPPRSRRLTALRAH